MLELSDVNEFAQASYGPLVIAAATLLVASCFLKIQPIVGQSVDWLVGLFSGMSNEGADGANQQLLRIVIVALLFFAWPAVFNQLSNIAPFVSIYDPRGAMFHNRSEWYPALGCYFIDSNANERMISQFIWNNVEILPEERAKYFRESIGRSLSPWFFAQSMLTLLVLCGAVAWARPEYRVFRLRSFLLSISIIAYLLLSGRAGLENSVTDRYFALLDVHYTSIPIKHREETNCSKALDEKFPDPGGDVPQVVRVELRWPRFSSVVPF